VTQRLRAEAALRDREAGLRRAQVLARLAHVITRPDAGGLGADTADLLTALDSWVMGQATAGTLTAQKLDPASGAVLFERPLCRYPQYPRYTGPASDPAAAKLASNYSCS
jgi:hypothetical protein